MGQPDLLPFRQPIAPPILLPIYLDDIGVEFFFLLGLNHTFDYHSNTLVLVTIAEAVEGENAARKVGKAV